MNKFIQSILRGSFTSIWSLSKKLSLDNEPFINTTFKWLLFIPGGHVKCNAHQSKGLTLQERGPMQTYSFLPLHLQKHPSALPPLPLHGRSLSASYAVPVLLAFRIIEFKLPIEVRAGGDPTNPFKVNIHNGGLSPCLTHITLWQARELSHTYTQWKIEIVIYLSISKWHCNRVM